MKVKNDRWHRKANRISFLVLFQCAAAAAFQHPGVLNSKAELDFIKLKIQAGAQPWKKAYDELRVSSYASLDYTAKPREMVRCGRFSNPSEGCGDEQKDAIAAYTHALLWYFSGTKEHAGKAIQIMNAWSAVLKGHELANTTIQEGWTGSIFLRAAEIIRHSGAGWAAGDVEGYSAMLRNAYLPDLINGQAGVDGMISIFGNWDLIMTEAIIAIAVFLDDRALFEKALELWRKRVPAYFYLTKDGQRPLPPPDAPNPTQADLVKYWFGQSTFPQDGMCQEACRDVLHLQYGISASAAVAEIAWHQGVDLYAEQAERLTKAMEFHAKLINGGTVPGWLCGGNLEGGGAANTWEVAYNHFHNRMGMELPNTKILVERNRPTGTDHSMVWESMTHAELSERVVVAVKPKVGRAPVVVYPEPLLRIDGRSFIPGSR